MQEQIEHHPTLYFQNGDIILSAPRSESTATTITWMFRVDKIYLFRSSPIFADMLAMPQPTDNSDGQGNEFYDGVPHVRLPDHAEDVAALLTVLYNHCAPRSC